MKKIMLTGCNGQLGRALQKEYEHDSSVSLILTDVDTLDITDIKMTLAFVSEQKPDAVINCAAHTNVNLCESDVDNAFRINAIGPRNLAIAAQKNNAKLVQVSTDYVFEGNGTRPYTEFDAVNPQGVYGSSKLAGEQFVKGFCDSWFIIRTAWLYGDGNNFVKTMLKLSEKHDTVSVVRDQFGTPTSAAELARMIVHLLPTDNYGLFHGTCEGSCHWAAFAKEIFRLAGTDTVVKEITTDEYPTPAKRPEYSVLDNYMLRLTTDYRFAPWENAIAEYMKDMK